MHSVVSGVRNTAVGHIHMQIEANQTIKILDDVNTYNELARHVMDKLEMGEKLSLEEWVYENGQALHKDDLQEVYDIIDLCGDA